LYLLGGCGTYPAANESVRATDALHRSMKLRDQRAASDTSLQLQGYCKRTRLLSSYGLLCPLCSMQIGDVCKRLYLSIR
jgi:hypothetical protein